MILTPADEQEIRNKLDEMICEASHYLRTFIKYPEETTYVYKGASGIDSEGTNQIDRAEQKRKRARSQEILTQCLEAINRLDKGEFGECLNPACGEDISIARLKAQPHAAFCIKCQTKIDARLRDQEKLRK